DVDGSQEAIALAGADALFLRVGGDAGGRELRRFGKVILAVEIEVERRADQRDARETGQGRSGEPSERRAPAFAAVDPFVAEPDRRLDAEFEADHGPVAAGTKTRKGGGNCRQGFSIRSILSPVREAL